MKRKKLVGKVFSILLSAALAFTSVDTPVYAAGETKMNAFDEMLYENATENEAENISENESEPLEKEAEFSDFHNTENSFEQEPADEKALPDSAREEAGIVSDDAVSTPTQEADSASKEETVSEVEAVSEDRINSEEESVSEDEVALEDETDSEDETVSESATNSEDKTVSEDEVALEDETDSEEETVSESATNSEDKTVSEDEVALEDETNSESEDISEEGMVSENGTVSENGEYGLLYEENNLVFEDAITGIKAGPYIVYGGEKDVDFTYKTDEVTKIVTLKVITTTPLVIETKTGKANAPIVLGNEKSPCDIHVTIRKAIINVSDSQNVPAISVPLNYTKNVYLTFEDNVKLTGAANCAGIQKNITSNAFTGAGYLYLRGNTTVTVTAGTGGAGIGGGIMEITDSKISPLTGKIVIEGNTITATGNGGGAGIGGCKGGSAKDITFTGGDVTAIGKSGGAGIGGGAKENNIGGSGSFLSVKGGKVTAKGSENGAGIGGGATGEGTNITIYGGNVTAEGGKNGAGIGGGSSKEGKDITIYGGTYIKAAGGENGAGIGGGSKGTGSNIAINGGDEIIAVGGNYGAGIGGGNGKEGKGIKINGGNLNASSERGGAAIGGGNNGKGSNITITYGNVTAYAISEKSNAMGAGIGGGNGAAGENIVIRGGVVDARSENGAGIGGGKAAEASNITIEEGNIYALGGSEAAGIGAGKGKNASNIKITGGTVVAVTDNDAADHYSLGAGYKGSSSNIYISGGSVNASVDKACIVTKDDTTYEPLSLKVYMNYTPGSRISLTNIVYADYYNANNLTVDSGGRIYLWLPENASVNEKDYTTTYEVKFVTNCYTLEPSQYLVSGAKIQIPDTKSYKVDQADFEGWYSSADFAENTKWSEDKTISGNIVLYAKWNHYNTIYYYDSVHKECYATEKVYDGQNPKGVKEPTRNNFVFTGWYYTNSAKLFDFNSPITENVSVSAGWDRITLPPYASINRWEEIKEGTQIQLKSNTIGATIYYTTDGSKPTRDSKIYTDPIAMTSDMMLPDGTVMIRAFAAMDGLIDSAINRYTYYFIPASKDSGEVLKQDYPNGEVSEIPLNNIWIAGLQDGYIYTGKAIKPEIRIYDGKRLLVEKKDYTLTYKNNVNAAGKKDPAITITGKGNYKGKLSPISFKINPANIGNSTSKDQFDAEDIVVAANGKVQTPAVVVTRNGKKLKKNKDYTVDYSQVQAQAGEYIVTVIGIGNYCGTRQVKLLVTDGILMNKVSVSKIAAQEYTGEALRPEVTVKYKGTTLVNGVDYTLEYQNNVVAGTAKVIVKAVAGSRCTGSKTVTFKIKGIPMKKVKVYGVIPEVQYTGENTQISDYRLHTNDGRVLVQGTDYYVSYENNVNAGTAKIIFTGMGGYTGKITSKFKIVPYNIEANQYKAFEVNVSTNAVYEKGGAVPKIQMFFHGKEMVEGKDYTLQIRNNDEVTTDKTQKLPTVKISGKGNFKGTLEDYTFTVSAAPLSRVSISVADKAFSESPGNHIVTPVLKDINGKTLTAGKDYSTTFQYTYYKSVKLANGTVKAAGSLVGSTDIIPAGTDIVVLVMSKEGGKYSGNVSTIYRITKKNIKGVSFSVKNQEYTGSEIMPGKSDILSKTVSSDDYEILEYTNNIEKGTATITIRGIGNYGGTKKVNFKIGAKQLIWVNRKTTTAAE